MGHGCRRTGLDFLLWGAFSLVLLCAGCKPEKPSAGERGKLARARVTEHGLAQDGVRGTPGGEQTPAEGGKGLTDEQRQLVVARIGEQTITLGDVERHLAGQPSFSRSRYRTFDKKVEFLNNLVQFEVLAIEARKKGYDTDPDVVLAMKRAMIQKFTATDMQKAVTVSAISDEDVAKYYANNRSTFQKPEQVRASHILFEDEESARRALEQIRAAFDADRTKARVVFNDFARRLSKDRNTAHLNGDLGFFSKEGYLDEARAGELRVPKEVVEAVFALPGLNKITDVVKSENGYHITQITNRRPAIDRSLEDARRQITNILLREKKDEARKVYIDGLREKAKVTVNEKLLEQLKVEEIAPEHGEEGKASPEVMASPPSHLALPGPQATPPVQPAGGAK